MSAPLRHLPSQESPQSLERRIRALLMEGRILDARDLLDAAGPDVPVDPGLRKVLAPAIVRKSNVRDVDRSEEFAWLKAHGAEYWGKWVALVGEKLVASSENLKELLSRLDQLDLDREPLIHHLI